MCFIEWIGTEESQRGQAREGYPSHFADLERLLNATLHGSDQP